MDSNFDNFVDMERCNIETYWQARNDFANTHAKTLQESDTKLQQKRARSEVEDMLIKSRVTNRRKSTCILPPDGPEYPLLSKPHDIIADEHHRMSVANILLTLT